MRKYGRILHENRGLHGTKTTCLSDGKNGRTEDWHTIFNHVRIGCEPG